MASDGKLTVTLSDTSNEINVAVPIFGYKTNIYYPYTINQLSSGHFSAFDDGSAYDHRSCEVSFEVSPEDMVTINNYITSTGRGKNDLILSMSSNSGFHPFAPDKGDTGPFTVAIEIKKYGKVTNEPFKYFVCDAVLHNTGEYPSYSLPSEIDEGEFTFGTVTNCRFPKSYFNPSARYAVYNTMTYSGAVEYIDQGINGDSYTTDFSFTCNESKTAAIISYLDAVRTNTFTVVAPSDYYMFGSDKGESGEYTVRFIQNNISVLCEGYNRYSFNLQLEYVS